MDWNSLSWKCNSQKKLIALLLVICGLLLFLIYVANMHIGKVEEYTIAHMAMEAAELSYRCGLADYQAQELKARANDLRLHYEALEMEIQSLTEPAAN